MQKSLKDAETFKSSKNLSQFLDEWHSMVRQKIKTRNIRWNMDYCCLFVPLLFWLICVCFAFLYQMMAQKSRKEKSFLCNQITLIIFYNYALLAPYHFLLVSFVAHTIYSSLQTILLSNIIVLCKGINWRVSGIICCLEHFTICTEHFWRNSPFEEREN